jgi:hypothetical protein
MALTTEEYKGAVLPAAPTDGTDVWGATQNTALKLVVDSVVGDAIGGVLNSAGHSHTKVYNLNGTVGIDCSGEVPSIGGFPIATASTTATTSYVAEAITDITSNNTSLNSDVYPSDYKLTTENAVKTYVDTALAALSGGAQLNWLGLWDSLAQYGANDLVAWHGVLYKGLSMQTGNDPSESPTLWQAMPLEGIDAALKSFIDSSVFAIPETSANSEVCGKFMVDVDTAGVAVGLKFCVSTGSDTYAWKTVTLT